MDETSMNIGIVGYGCVGHAVARYFQKHPKRVVFIYDKYQDAYSSSAHKRTVNKCDLVFVCVPTPSDLDGLTCDLSAVEDCLTWIDAPVCIRSTVIPGTVDRLTSETGKSIAFSPEYIGEQNDHPWRDEENCGFLVIGGPEYMCDLVAFAYAEHPNAELKLYRTTARTAELCKYMENCFLATKVAFVNQFYDIAISLGVAFEDLRRVWLADTRIGVSHSSVTAERGFGGRCLPKDLAAIVGVMKYYGGAPLLEAVLNYNGELRKNDELHKKAGHTAFPDSLAM